MSNELLGVYVEQVMTLREELRKAKEEIEQLKERLRNKEQDDDYQAIIFPGHHEQVQ